jgi:hypothetical protein
MRIGIGGSSDSTTMKVYEQDKDKNILLATKSCRHVTGANVQHEIDVLKSVQKSRHVVSYRGIYISNNSTVTCFALRNHFIRVIGSVFTGALELGIVAMELEGASMGKWHHDGTIQKVNAFGMRRITKTVWQFQEQHQRIHGDCHPDNVLLKLQSGDEVKLADLERSLPLRDILVHSHDHDTYLILRLIDVVHLLRLFFHVNTQQWMRRHPVLVAAHMNIWTDFAQFIKPHYDIVSDLRLKNLFKVLFDPACNGTYIPEDKYLNDMDDRDKMLDNIITGRWFGCSCCPLSTSRHNDRVNARRIQQVDFLAMIMFSKSRDTKYVQNIPNRIGNGNNHKK